MTTFIPALPSPPQPSQVVVRYMHIPMRFSKISNVPADNLKLTYDSETGELLMSEVLK